MHRPVTLWFEGGLVQAFDSCYVHDSRTAPRKLCCVVLSDALQQLMSSAALVSGTWFKNLWVTASTCVRTGARWPSTATTGPATLSSEHV